MVEADLESLARVAARQGVNLSMNGMAMDGMEIAVKTMPTKYLNQ